MAIEPGPQFPEELYHASPHTFKKGDIVEPSSSNNKFGEPMAWAGGYDDALEYKDTIDRLGSTGSFNKTRKKGKVYRVEPVNPDEIPHTLGSNHGSLHGYRIIKRSN